MTRLLKFKPFQASLSYSFVDPDTGFKYEADDQVKLRQHIKSYREQNELEPIDFLDTVIESYLCHLPENVGKCEPLPRLKRGLMSWVKGGVALVSKVLYEKTVSQEEADRRAKICVGCPKNVFPDKGPFIFWADKLAEASVGNKKSSAHDELGNCEICSCNMRAKVWWGGKIYLSLAEEEEMIKVNCWQPQAKNGVGNVG